MNGSRPTSPWRSNGLPEALGAYVIWGFMPLFFKQLQGISPVEIVAHRVMWSVILVLAILWARKSLGEFRAAITDPRTRRFMLASTTLIAANWLIYIWAITNQHILAGSLGYYLNPLANILLGRFIHGEQLTRRQWSAVGIAAAGVAVLAAGALDTLWISLVLCFSFGSYGLLRKIVQVDALAGLSIETGLLFPVAFIWLFLGGMAGFGIFGQPGILTALLMAAGVIAIAPLAQIQDRRQLDRGQFLQKSYRGCPALGQRTKG